MLALFRSLPGVCSTRRSAFPIVFIAPRGNPPIVASEVGLNFWLRFSVPAPAVPRARGRDGYPVTILILGWCPKIEQRAGRVVIELAGLGPSRRAHRQDEFRGLIRRVERQRVLAGKHGGAHPG